MPISFYCGSGSPYAWRVWLALEHKQVPYDLKMMSFSGGDLHTPAYQVLNPRQKVPVIVDEGFALYESAAIVEYLEERFPDSGRHLFPGDLHQRAVVRRLIGEFDHYLSEALDKLLDCVLFTAPDKWDATAIGLAREGFAKELATIEGQVPASGFLAGDVGAADFALYPQLALSRRMERRKPDIGIVALLGPKTQAWMQRIEALPYFQATYPPHWKSA